MVTAQPLSTDASDWLAGSKSVGPLSSSGLNVRIHRGAHEVGGNCVELEYQGSRIVLDVGKPLWAGWDEVVPLPAVPGLADGSDPSLAGVIISHPHLDHYGLIDQVHSSVPVYIGREASLLLAEAEFFSAAGVKLHPSGFLVHRVPIRVGAFTVTPYLADHSGYDSYSLLVEAGGKRLFYTGDIRGHGRKSRLFEELLGDPPESIDVLLCEGTHIRMDDPGPGKSGVEEAGRSEVDVERSLARRMMDTEGAVIVISSAQNIDRAVTAYRACLRAGRTLVTDLYTASIAAAVGRPSIPQPGFPSYRVYVPSRQRAQVKASGQFDRLASVRTGRVFPQWLACHRSDITLLQRTSAVPELLRLGLLAGGTLVWSMWPGYLRDAASKRLLQSLESEGVPCALDHSSGHAAISDLRRMVDALDPTTVVPIHTDGAERFGDLFEGVQRRFDLEWWSV